MCCNQVNLGNLCLGQCHSWQSTETLCKAFCTCPIKIASSLPFPESGSLTCGVLLQPIVLERIPKESGSRASWIHTKALYRLRPESKDIIKGCSDEMCSTAAFLSGVKVTDWVDED